jgi:hypothetical protein
MKKDFGFKGYENRQASSFWLREDFDTSFRNGSKHDYTKLAAAQRAIGNFVNIVTGQQIPVVFQSNDSSYTDGKKVVIGTKLEDKNFDSAVGLALHEGSHIAFTDFSLFEGATRLSNSKFGNHVRMRGLDPDMDMKESDFRIIKDLLNWIEDRRIDYKIYTNAPGYRMYYEAMYNKYFNDKVIDKALLVGEKTNEDFDCYLFHIINFTNSNRKLDSLTQLRTIWNLIDLRNINRLKTTLDALDVACEVYKVIKTAVNEAEVEANVSDSSNDTSESGSTPGQGNGSFADLDNDTDDSDMYSDDNDMDFDPSDAQESSDQTSLSKKEQDKLEKAIEAQRDFLRDNVKKTGRLSKSDAKIVEAIKESGTETRMVYTDDGGVGCPVTTVVIKKITPSIIQSIPSLFASYSYEYASGQKVLDPVNPTYSAREIVNTDNAVNRGILLGKRLGAKLQLRNSDRSLKTTRLTAGKIDRRLISQLGYQNVNVFQRIVTDRYKNYFIHISIDASGSMSGKKFRNAITSAVAIAQAASMTTGIRVQISVRGTENVGSNTEKAVTIYAYDSAHDKMNKIKTYFKYLDTFGCTPEGIAFKSIEQDIKKDAKGDECIFINYSDGEPTSVTGVANRYDGVRFTKKVVNGFRDLGITIISYFIYESYLSESTQNNFRTMYGSDASFINPVDMTDIAKSMNSKFLEISK